MVTKKKPTTGTVKPSGGFRQTTLRAGGGQLPRYSQTKKKMVNKSAAGSSPVSKQQPSKPGRATSYQRTRTTNAMTTGSRTKTISKPRPTRKGTTISSSTRSNLTAAQRQALQRRRNKARLNKRTSTRK